MRLITLFLLVLSFVPTTTMADRTFTEEVRLEVQEGHTRDDKIREVFAALIQSYEDEEANTFMSYVSENKFFQDHFTFRQAIEKDFRMYDINDITYQIDKIESDGPIKRYLFVNWQKRYEIKDDITEREQRGYSRFLFDEENGVYKLTEIAGNNLWGISLTDWTDEVSDINGQEENNENGGNGTGSTGGGNTPTSTIDLDATNLIRPFGGAMDVEFDLNNHGTSDVIDDIEYEIKTVCQGDPDDIIRQILPGIGANETKHIVQNTLDGYPGCTVTVTIDYDDNIEEFDETNNVTTVNVQ